MPFMNFVFFLGIFTLNNLAADFHAKNINVNFDMLAVCKIDDKKR